MATPPEASQSKEDKRRENKERRIKEKREKSDNDIQETNSSSILSKRSVEKLYLEPGKREFFKYFVTKDARRSPLINRNYWIRMEAIEQAVHFHLNRRVGERKKVVVNLGCGFDALPFQFLDEGLEDELFIDIDYPPLIRKKAEIIKKTEELTQLLGETTYDDGPIAVRSKNYIAIACDLSNIEELDRIFKEENLADEADLEFIAEVSLCYMEPEDADAVIRWTSTFECATFILHDQIMPNSQWHPFAQVMLKFYEDAGTPIKAVLQRPTVPDQVKRFKEMGFTSIAASDLVTFWYDHVSSSQKAFINSIEPFDEWEEFYLYCQHHFILHATIGLANSVELQPNHSHAGPGWYCTIPLSMPYCLNPIFDSDRSEGKAEFFKTKSLRRKFGAASSFQDYELFHGGCSEVREDSTILIKRDSKCQEVPIPTTIPAARMCHTITGIRDNQDLLLVGGRESPEKPLSDCWLRTRKGWKQVQNLPSGRYRHSACWVDDKQVLVFGGRDGKSVLDEWLLWDTKGWVTLEPNRKIPARHSSQMVLTGPNKGLVISGLNDEGIILEDVWGWTVEGRKVILQDWTAALRNSRIYRFGGQCATIQTDGVVDSYIVGGICKNSTSTVLDEIIMIETDIISIRRLQLQPEHHANNIPVGMSLSGHDGELVIAGGGAFCANFGHYWNDGFWVISRNDLKYQSEVWKAYIEAPEPRERYETTRLIPDGSTAEFGRKNKIRGISELKDFLVPEMDDPKPEDKNKAPVKEEEHSHETKKLEDAVEPVVTPKPTGRVEVHSAEDFAKVMARGKPVLLTGVSIGDCIEKWTPDYLIEKVGGDREVIIHRAQPDVTHMNFVQKNFKYEKIPFRTFINTAFDTTTPSHSYLRSVSSISANSKPAVLATDFPTIASDFTLPPSVDVVTQNAHSSPLRISSANVGMWLHFDVMANILCHIRGRKRFRLYPPTDVLHLSIPPGSSSSTIENIFDTNIPGTTPYELIMEPGDILYIPECWPHAALPLDPCISVNVFFRNLGDAYAHGKDVYGNRDIAAYENGRRAVQKVKKDLDKVPVNVRKFYLERLAQELLEMAKAEPEEEEQEEEKVVKEMEGLNLEDLPEGVQVLPGGEGVDELDLSGMGAWEIRPKQ